MKSDRLSPWSRVSVTVGLVWPRCWEDAASPTRVLADCLLYDIDHRREPIQARPANLSFSKRTNRPILNEGSIGAWHLVTVGSPPRSWLLSD